MSKQISSASKIVVVSLLPMLAMICLKQDAPAQVLGSSNKLRLAQNSRASKNSGIDSANEADTVKSWTSESAPSAFDQSFLDSLKWEERKVGDYALRLGKIQNRWFAAMQLTKNGKAVLTEYTPPAEYIVVIDPRTGAPLGDTATPQLARDGIVRIAFAHLKLNDANYHMYSVYELPKTAPKLVWKSGGKFGDWLHKANQNMPGGALWTGSVSK